MVGCVPRPCGGKQMVVERLIYMLIITLSCWPFPCLSYHQHFLMFGNGIRCRVGVSLFFLLFFSSESTTPS